MKRRRALSKLTVSYSSPRGCQQPPGSGDLPPLDEFAGAVRLPEPVGPQRLSAVLGRFRVPGLFCGVAGCRLR